MKISIIQEEGYTKPSLEIIDLQIESSILKPSDSSDVGGEGDWG